MNVLIAIYPYLFAVFPTLFLFFNNLPQYPVSFSETVIPLIMVIVFTFVCVEGLSRLFKNRQKPSLVVSLFVLLFFSYGRLETVFLRYPEFFPPLYLTLIFSCLTYAIISVRREFFAISRAAAMVGVLLVLMQPMAYIISRSTDGVVPGSSHTSGSSGAFDASAVRPDIYYIILDGYARQDVLSELYDHDNLAFIDELKGLGFFVAKNSSSNYPQTIHSLASSLNMTYLDDFADRVGKQRYDRKPIEIMVQENAVLSFLTSRDYLTVAFGSGFRFTELKNADIFLNPNYSLSEFQNLLLGSTPIPALSAKLSIGSISDTYRKRVLFTFDHLTDFTNLQNPKFVFAHLISPHPPFVFDEHGGPIISNRLTRFSDGNELIQSDQDREDYRKYYQKQLSFVSKKILTIVRQLITNSKTPPIIILQSDHGPGLYWDIDSAEATNLHERMSNLTALHLPGTSDILPYDSMTPVNIFRLIFNRYFGASYEKLDDKNFFMKMNAPYDFIDVTDEMSRP